MSFESCFGGFAGSKSAPAAMGGKEIFAGRAHRCSSVYDYPTGENAMQAGSRDRVDRRLAAILAADVVGYSRLMEADEAGTARMLREHRAAGVPLVAEHGGRIVKT